MRSTNKRLDVCTGIYTLELAAVVLGLTVLTAAFFDLSRFFAAKHAAEVASRAALRCVTALDGACFDSSTPDTKLSRFRQERTPITYRVKTHSVSAESRIAVGVVHTFTPRVRILESVNFTESTQRVTARRRYNSVEGLVQYIRRKSAPTVTNVGETDRLDGHRIGSRRMTVAPAAAVEAIFPVPFPEGFSHGEELPCFVGEEGSYPLRTDFSVRCADGEGRAWTPLVTRVSGMSKGEGTLVIVIEGHGEERIAFGNGSPIDFFPFRFPSNTLRANFGSALRIAARIESGTVDAEAVVELELVGGNYCQESYAFECVNRIPARKSNPTGECASETIPAGDFVCVPELPADRESERNEVLSRVRTGTLSFTRLRPRCDVRYDGDAEDRLDLGCQGQNTARAELSRRIESGSIPGDAEESFEVRSDPTDARCEGVWTGMQSARCPAFGEHRAGGSRNFGVAEEPDADGMIRGSEAAEAVCMPGWVSDRKLLRDLSWRERLETVPFGGGPLSVTGHSVCGRPPEGELLARVPALRGVPPSKIVWGSGIRDASAPASFHYLTSKQSREYPNCGTVFRSESHEGTERERNFTCNRSLTPLQKAAKDISDQVAAFCSSYRKQHGSTAEQCELAGSDPILSNVVDCETGEVDRTVVPSCSEFTAHPGTTVVEVDEAMPHSEALARCEKVSDDESRRQRALRRGGAELSKSAAFQRMCTVTPLGTKPSETDLPGPAEKARRLAIEYVRGMYGESSDGATEVRIRRDESIRGFAIETRIAVPLILFDRILGGPVWAKGSASAADEARVLNPG